MAVFMINICKFNGCGITFPSLGDLIQHIEDTHIDYDPLVVEQKEASQPSCLPLSYVLRYFTEATRRELQNSQAVSDMRRRLLPPPKTPSIRSSTPTGSELDDDELMSQSEDSNDSWTTVEEYSSEFILRYGSRIQGQVASAASLGAPPVEKPFACPVPGCKKRYKNVNGIKYHSKNGHKKDGKVKKGYKCQCGKNYKTAQGLKNHSALQHTIQSPSTLTSSFTTPATVIEDRSPSVTKSMQVPIQKPVPNLIVTASQPHNRPFNVVEGIEINKFVKIYDTLKTKDTVSSFTIPRHTLSNFTIVGRSIESPSQIQNSNGVVTSSYSSPIDKLKYSKDYPKVTVQSNPSVLMSKYANDRK